jgi:hypothetical protein
MTDAQVRAGEFHQLPYHRMLLGLFWELTTPDAVLEAISGSILDLFGLVFVGWQCIKLHCSAMLCSYCNRAVCPPSRMVGWTLSDIVPSLRNCWPEIR